MPLVCSRSALQAKLPLIWVAPQAKMPLLSPMNIAAMPCTDLPLKGNSSSSRRIETVFHTCTRVCSRSSHHHWALLQVHGGPQCMEMAPSRRTKVLWKPGQNNIVQAEMYINM